MVTTWPAVDAHPPRAFTARDTAPMTRLVLLAATTCEVPSAVTTVPLT